MVAPPVSNFITKHQRIAQLNSVLKKMQSMKGAAASAKAGMEKAKASMQEKVDQMKTSDPTEKERARERKEYRQEDAEMRKQEARHHNAGHGAGVGTVGYGGGDIHDVNPTGGAGFTTGRGGLNHNRGGTGGYGGGGIHDVNPTGGVGFTTGGLNHNRGGIHDVNPSGAGAGFTHNRGETGGYGGGGVHDASRGYRTADTGTGYDSGRQVRSDENMNMGYGGDTGGGLGYSTTGGNIGGTGGGAGFTHNRGETGGYGGGGGVHDASRGYPTADIGTGYDSGRQVRSDENMNMGYGGDTGGGLGYSTTGGNIGGTGGGAGFTHNRGETGDYGGGGVHDASRGYPTADTGTGYDSGRQVRSDENMNMGYGGDTGGGLGYSTTGGNIGGTGDPNNQGTRRNTRGNQGDHYDRSY